MLILTGNETSASELLARQQRHPEVGLQEVRLDFLNEIPSDPAAFIADPSRVVIVCRPIREGGVFKRNEAKRLKVLRDALSWNIRAIDLETDIEAGDASQIICDAGKRSVRVIRSTHLKSFYDLDASWQRLCDCEGDVLKIAVPTDGAEELLALFELKDPKKRQLIKIGMGTGGVISRVAYSRFGSEWCYVSEKESSATASGQFSLNDAALYGLADGAETAPLALLGGPQITSSPGPEVHNRIFRKLGLPWAYTLLPSMDPAKAIELLHRLGFKGASITMPHKFTVAGLLNNLDELASRWKTVNTIVVDKSGRLSGHNTDGPAVIEVLGGPHHVAGKKVTVIGTGGAAQAVAFALAEAGAKMTIAGRDAAKAAGLASSIHGKSIDLSAALTVDFDVLVSAVPKEAHVWGDLQADFDWGRKTVVDLQISPSPFARAARLNGARVIYGSRFWCAQAAAQQSLWTGKQISTREVMDVYTQAFPDAASELGEI